MAITNSGVCSRLEQERAKVVFYSATAEPDELRILNGIRQIVAQNHPETTLEIHHHLIGMIAILSRSISEPRPVVFITLAGHEEFKELYPARELFIDIPLLVVLKIDDPELIRLAHQLSPRFVCNPPCEEAALGQILTGLLAGQSRCYIPSGETER